MKLIVGAVVLVGLLLVADLTARSYAESRLQTAVDQHAGSDVRAKAHIHSFPFLGRLLLAQNVKEVDVDVTDLAVQGLTFGHVGLALSGVKVDRNKLVGDQQVRLTSIDNGTVTADLSQAALSAAVGMPVQLTGGRVVVGVLGRSLAADVEVRDNRLALRVAGVTLPSFSVPATALLPCLGNAQVREGTIHFSCTVHQVPPAILNLVNGASAR